MTPPLPPLHPHYGYRHVPPNVQGRILPHVHACAQLPCTTAFASFPSPAVQDRGCSHRSLTPAIRWTPLSPGAPLLPALEEPAVISLSTTGRMTNDARVLRVAGPPSLPFKGAHRCLRVTLLCGWLYSNLLLLRAQHLQA